MANVKVGAPAQKKSANAAKIYEPTQVDLETGQEKEIIFRCLNPNDRYRKGSLSNVALHKRRPPQTEIPAVCRVRYFFSDEEKQLALNDNKKLPDSTILTAYYNNGQAGYIEDLDHVKDPKEFMGQCKSITFAASPDIDSSFTPLLIVRPEQTELLWYLRTCSYNEGSKNRSTEHAALFYEHKPTQIAKQSLDAKRLTIKASNRFVEGLADENPEVRNAVWTQHLAIAHSFGLDIFRSPSEVERDILWLIERNAASFMQASQNPANYMIFVLRMAERANIISVDRNTNTFRFGDNKSVITSFSLGSDPFVEMAKWCQNADNEATYTKIKGLWEENNNKGFANFSASGLVANIE